MRIGKRLIVVLLCVAVLLFGAVFWTLKTSADTDAAQYEAALAKAGYPTRGTYFFPASIPEDAEDVTFSYSPAIGQGGQELSLCFTAPDVEHWEKDGFALWSGSASSWEKEAYGVFGSVDTFREESSGDVMLYILYSQAGAHGNWNHGEVGYCAVSRADGRVMLRYEHW